MKPANAALWRNREFLIVWLGQSISMFGTRVSYIAWIWWMLSKTDSAAAVAGIGIAAALPNLLLGPFAGACVDRWDRRRLMIVMNFLNVAILGAAAFLMFGRALEPWRAYALTALSATAAAFHRPALQSSIPNLVDEDQLTRANSMYQISRGVAGLLGLSIGGVLVGFIGEAPTFLLDASTFAIAALLLLPVVFASPRTGDVVSWRSIVRDTVNGFRFLCRRKALLYLVLLFALINFLLAPTSVLFPIMSRDVLDAGPEGFGWLNAAISAGLLIGGFLTAALRRFKYQGWAILVGLLAIGLLMIGFGISRNLFLSMLFMAVVGIAVSIVNVFESVVFQSRVPNELQGRVFAAQFAVCDGLQPLSLAVIGVLLTAVSAPCVIIGSGLAILLAVVGGLASRDLRAL